MNRDRHRERQHLRHTMISQKEMNVLQRIHHKKGKYRRGQRLPKVLDISGQIFPGPEKKKGIIRVAIVARTQTAIVRTCSYKGISVIKIPLLSQSASAKRNRRQDQTHGRKYKRLRAENGQTSHCRYAADHCGIMFFLP